jgi:sec-independent protein translocase protein TatA
MEMLIIWSPGGWDMIVILIIVLILFGANRLPDIARGTAESIENFKRGLSGISREQRRQGDDSRLGWFIVLAVIAVAVIFSVLSLDVFSGEQKLALTIVLLGWIGVGYWSFGRNLRKGNDR